MNKRDILEKAIEKARLKGYMDLEDAEIIVFSRKFARAFFGEEDSIYSQNAWVNRLKEMSRTDDVYKYLEKFL